MDNEDKIVVLGRYILGQRVTGRDPDDITTELSAAGWDSQLITDACMIANLMVVSATKNGADPNGLSQYAEFTSMPVPRASDFESK